MFILSFGGFFYPEVVIVFVKFIGLCRYIDRILRLRFIRSIRIPSDRILTSPQQTIFHVKSPNSIAWRDVITVSRLDIGEIAKRASHRL